MNKRDILSEIRSRQLRTGSGRQFGYCYRLDQIDHLIQGMSWASKETDELLRYIPLALIAVVESHFRILYALIINQDAEYLSRAVKFSKEQNMRFEPEFLVAFHARSATPGDLFSHLFRLNGLEDIQATLTALLGMDYLKEVQRFDVNEAELTESEADTFKNITGASFKAIKDMFALRHIIAHELALNLTLDSQKMLDDYRRVKELLQATTTWVEVKLGIFIPAPQQWANRHRQAAFEKADQQLQTIIDKLVHLQTGEREFPLLTYSEPFLKAVEKWKEFREAYADALAAPYDGGSAQSSVYNEARIRQTANFLQYLEDTYQDLLEIDL